MSRNRFFQLENEAAVIEWKSSEDFEKEVKGQREVADRLYRPDKLTKLENFRKIDKCTFKNVSFTKTTISELTFDECTFVDCLFIGTNFEECEFHHCYFERCNFSKASFRKCYADPYQFQQAVDLNSYSNIAIGLFKELATNAFFTNQREHQADAEFRFRQAKRYQLKYSLKQGKIRQPRYFFVSKWHLMLEYLYGYGWRPGRLSVAILIFCIFLFIANTLLWNFYGLVDVSNEDLSYSLPHCFHLTYASLTTLGLNGMETTTPFGLVALAVQGLFGVVILSLIASIIFRFVVRR